MEINDHAHLPTAAQTVDWGVLIEDTQGGLVVHLEGVERATAARMLREAAAALEEDG
jgi:hypothetical protein